MTIGKYCVPASMGQNRTIVEKQTRSTVETFVAAAGDAYKVIILLSSVIKPLRSSIRLLSRCFSFWVLG